MNYRAFCLTFLAIALFATPAQANIGLPMIFITLPWMGVALIPVIFFESFIILRRLELTFGVSTKVASVSNIVSTLIGMPVTWLVLVLIQGVTGGGGAHGLNSPAKKLLAVTWQAPWLIPYESEFYWMVPAATIVLIVPFFFSSWLVEYWVSGAMLGGILPKKIKKAVLIANLYSYGLLLLIVVGILIFSVFANR